VVAPDAVRLAWLITGIPGAGKSTVARLLAATMPRAAHIEGDRLGELIVSGAVRPDAEPREESRRQMRLNVRNQCLLARSFAGAGFVPVMDYVVVDRARLGLYRRLLPALDLRFVVLHPGREVALARDRARPEKTVAAAFAYLEDILVRELAGTGLWVASGRLSPEETVALILREQDRARID
jgi:predicted kinase